MIPALASQSDFHNFCPLAIFQIFTTLSLLTLVVPLQSDTLQGRRWTEDFVTSAGRFIHVAAFLLQQGMVQFHITTATGSFVAFIPVDENNFHFFPRLEIVVDGFDSRREPDASTSFMQTCSSEI